jgi:hypothetical protein
MKIEELWREMESEARAGTSAAWLTRFALPAPVNQLLVALETSRHLRALLLPLHSAPVPERSKWPNCRGLELFGISLGGLPHFGVGLKDVGFADIFTALAEDLARRLSVATRPQEAVQVMLTRLQRWQKFLAAGSTGLSAEQQRGLYGELHTLLRHLIPGIGTQLAIESWKAPDAAHQDFQLATGAVEIKTTIAKQPQTIRVTSERQLDDIGIPGLFLHVVVLDERDIADHPSSSGENLPEMVKGVRRKLDGNEGLIDTFNDRLLDSGYLERDAARYEGRRFSVRAEHTFHIRAGFPRVTESDLPNGVGDISYALQLSACARFATTTIMMIAALRPATHDSQAASARQ